MKILFRRNCKKAFGSSVNTGARDLLLQSERQKFLAEEWPRISANIQRLGLYAMDQFRVSPQLTINYGLRWDTTFGLFEARRSQLENPAFITLKALGINLIPSAPHDDRELRFRPTL